MTVKELIEELNEMPQDSDVKMVFNDTEGEFTEVIFERNNRTVWLSGEVS